MEKVKRMIDTRSRPVADLLRRQIGRFEAVAGAGQLAAAVERRPPFPAPIWLCSSCP